MTSDNDSTRLQGERRRHVRVRDAVGLQVRKLVELPAAGDGSPQTTAPAVELHARQPNKYDIPGYATVRSDHPAVAEYIAMLEERIRQLLLDGDPGTEQPTHKVSLSSDGLVFADDTLRQPGELLGITLTLFPHQKRIGTDCQVEPLNGLRESAMNGEHTCRVRFLRMSDPDRRTLQQHIEGLIDSLPALDEDEDE